MTTGAVTRYCKEQNASQQTVINITNNNTTTINGDVYVNKPDWF
jgi:hypothetical protein